jgi:hypothetical protein
MNLKRDMNMGNHEVNEKEVKHQRGGTHEQHVEAGKKGGQAPHKCRGRQCSKM